MLWIRGLAFTLLVEGIVVVAIPYALNGGKGMAGGIWQLGWMPVALGVAAYVSCLGSFLAAGGTPALFCTRPFRAIIGEEPAGLVRNRLYGFSRNPIYCGVVIAVLGEALLFASILVALYGVLLWIIFHSIVVIYEEPHLRAKQGSTYNEYCRRVPRWLGLRKSPLSPSQ